MIKAVDNNGRSPREIAEAEIAKEKAEKAVELLKEKFRQLDKAKTIVANIEREIEDLEQQIEDGDI